jgi:hypothetical protein
MANFGDVWHQGTGQLSAPFGEELRAIAPGLNLTDEQVAALAKVYHREIIRLVDWCVDLLCDEPPEPALPRRREGRQDGAETAIGPRSAP